MIFDTGYVHFYLNKFILLLILNCSVWVFYKPKNTKNPENLEFGIKVWLKVLQSFSLEKLSMLLSSRHQTIKVT